MHAKDAPERAGHGTGNLPPVGNTAAVAQVPFFDGRHGAGRCRGVVELGPKRHGFVEVGKTGQQCERRSRATPDKRSGARSKLPALHRPADLNEKLGRQLDGADGDGVNGFVERAEAVRGRLR